VKKSTIALLGTLGFVLVVLLAFLLVVGLTLRSRLEGTSLLPAGRLQALDRGVSRAAARRASSPASPGARRERMVCSAASETPAWRR
jgi:hypothetical protein